MGLNWYAFMYEGTTITSTKYRRQANSADHVREGLIDIYPENWVAAYDDLGAFLAATKWLEAGKPYNKLQGYNKTTVWVPEKEERDGKEVK